VVCAEINKSGCKPGDPTSTEYATDKGDWYMFDAALAVQNMALAAHGLGLATVIMGAFNAPAVEEILGIPEGYRVVVMMPLGVPAWEGKAPPRKSLDEIVVKDRWGS
jgi:nitroreductase